MYLMNMQISSFALFFQSQKSAYRLQWRIEYKQDVCKSIALKLNKEVGDHQHVRFIIDITRISP